MITICTVTPSEITFDNFLAEVFKKPEDRRQNQVVCIKPETIPAKLDIFSNLLHLGDRTKGEKCIACIFLSEKSEITVYCGKEVPYNTKNSQKISARPVDGIVCCLIWVEEISKNHIGVKDMTYSKDKREVYINPLHKIEPHPVD